MITRALTSYCLQALVDGKQMSLPFPYPPPLFPSPSPVPLPS